LGPIHAHGAISLWKEVQVEKTERLSKG
jgi:hypothetical protein